MLLPATFVLLVQIGIGMIDPMMPMDSHTGGSAILVVGIVVFSVVIFRVIEQQERTIVAQANQAEALNEIAAEVTALQEPGRLIALTLERTARLLRTEAAALAHVDADGITVRVGRFAPGAAPQIAESTIGLQEGIAGHVIATGQSIVAGNLSRDLPSGVKPAPLLGTPGLRSLVAVPLRSGGEVIGALVAASTSVRRFETDQVDLLTRLANQVAIALTNADLLARAQLAAGRLERLIETSGDAIMTIDLEGRILTWNHGAETIYGWSRAEAVGSILPMVPSDLVDDARNLIEEMKVTRKPLISHQTDRLRKDGRRIGIVVTGSPIVNTAGDIVAFLGISKDMSAHRQIEAQERRLAVFEDRERIGMELHDGAIQSLYAVGLGIEAVGQVIESNPVLARERLDQARDAVNDVIREIRSYIVDLRPDAFGTGGLVHGINVLAAETRRNTKIETSVEISPLADRALTADQAQQIFQIVREALSNISRHAAARRVQISLQIDHGAWNLAVTDDGAGFDPAMRQSGGFGLRNMQERSRRLSGTLMVDSHPGAGTTVRLTLPASLERSA